MINFPFWITNFKNYEEAVGENAVRLAKIHERVANDTGCAIGIAVNVVDLARVAQAVKIPVFAQHLDAIEYGKNTGWILPQTVQFAGANGTLLNHSERRLDKNILKKSCDLAKKLNLMRLVCAKNPEELGKFAQTLDVDFLAFEPPELIGSKIESVASAKPKSITDSVRLAHGKPVFVGAGIRTAQDIEASLSLGAQGFLVASAVVQASDPEKVLRTLVKTFAKKK